MSSFASRVLVTGAQGFLGRHLVAELLGSDHGQRLSVLGVGRSAGSDRHFTHRLAWAGRLAEAPLPAPLGSRLADLRYRYVPLDVCDRPGLTRLLQEFRPTCVVHLATVRDAPSLEALFAANVGAAEALVETLVGSGIERPRVVFGSTGGTYGNLHRDEPPARESRPLAPLDGYSAAMRAAEEAFGLLCDRFAIERVVARLFNLVGPGTPERFVFGALASQVAAIRKGLRESCVRVGPLDATRDFLDVRDAGAALGLLAREGAAGETYNVASGRERTVRSLLDAFLARVGLADQVDVEQLAEPVRHVARQVADTGRLAALGFRGTREIETSIEDALDYYLDRVAFGSTPAGPPRAAGPGTLAVSVQAQHRYDVEVEAGLLASLPRRLAARFSGARMAVLSDTRVQALYGDELVRGMREAGIETASVVLPEGERSKALDRYAEVIRALHESHFDRRAVLVNLGGGLVTDVGGFVASSYMRGISYVNVPTTLLAQHDSAIGGKVAVNTPWAKNFIGAFHHPRAVYCDTRVLQTLSQRDLAAGIAESIKVSLAGEVALFELLESRAEAIVGERDATVLDEVVRRSAARKIALLDPDPYEIDLRRVLNLGHTVAHPLEVELEYAGLLHGEAVAVGLAMATAVSLDRRTCSAAAAERIFRLLEAYDLPPRIPRAALAAACTRLDDIRLVRGGLLNFVLPVGIAEVAIVPELPDAAFRSAIDTLARHPRMGRRLSGSA